MNSRDNVGTSNQPAPYPADGANVPLHYRRDDANHLIRVTATDPVTLTDMITFLHELVATGAWQYGRIFDTRASTTPMPEEEATVIGYMQTLAAEYGPPGPLAVVAREPSMIARCEVHAWRMATVRSGSVFWDPDDAAEWLINARRSATD